MADRGRRRLGRRQFVVMCAVVGLCVVGVVVAVVERAAVAAGGGAPLSTAQQEDGMVAGRPFVDPPEVDASDGSSLTIRLDAAKTRFLVSGRLVWGESYTGSLVAPTIRVRPGSNLTISLVNDLPVATNLHFHGLHVSPVDNSDNPFICVPPKSTQTYDLSIPADHAQGTFWYHSHAMGTSCPAPASSHSSATGTMDMSTMGPHSMSGSSSPQQAFVPGDVENQIFAGLSGALVIGDDRRLLPEQFREINAHTLVFKDIQLDSSGHIIQHTDKTSIDSNAATVRLLNGQLRPVIIMHPGQTQLWRLVNAGADIFYQLHLDGHTFTVIGEDGVAVAQVTTEQILLLPPGKRYEVLVTAADTVQQTTLRTTTYSNGPQGDTYPDTALATVAVSGAAVSPLPALTGSLPTAPADLSQHAVANHRSVDLSENATGTAFQINGQQFMMGNSSVFDSPARLGTVEEWTVRNHSGEDHPLHLHTTHFQVVSINDAPQPYTHMQDTAVVPHATDSTPGRIVIRVAFTDYPGKWMFHCHIAAHEDNGMMSYINVTP